MHITKPFKILGTGMYLPPNKVRSIDLERERHIPEGWSEKYSGVKERYVAGDISGGEMGAQAVEAAISRAGLQLKDIDLLISCSATFDYPLPNQAVVIKAALAEGRAHTFPAVSVDSTCTGFISGLEIAAHLLDPQRYQNIAIVSAEIASKGIDPDNWETSTLFGDAAVAVVISHDNSGQSGLIKALSHTYSEGVHQTIIRGGGNTHHAKDHVYDKTLFSFKMEGMSLLKLAKKYIPPFMEEFFSDLDLKIEEVDYILPHQASQLGLALFKKMFDFKEGQVLENLSKYGNCISASVPLLLHEGWSSGQVKAGDTCLLCGTSAGFSIGSVLIKI